MATWIKTTQDGRRLEVVGQAICLDGRLEALDLVEVAVHPNRLRISDVMPEATHMAGRVPLTRQEADAAIEALRCNEARLLGDPRAIHERFRLAVTRKACEQGIE